jgi:hypothetical protein
MELSILPQNIVNALEIMEDQLAIDVNVIGAEGNNEAFEITKTTFFELLNS